MPRPTERSPSPAASTAGLPFAPLAALAAAAAGVYAYVKATEDRGGVFDPAQDGGAR